MSIKVYTRISLFNKTILFYDDEMNNIDIYIPLFYFIDCLLLTFTPKILLINNENYLTKWFLNQFYILITLNCFSATEILHCKYRIFLDIHIDNIEFVHRYLIAPNIKIIVFIFFIRFSLKNIILRDKIKS